MPLESPYQTPVEQQAPTSSLPSDHGLSALGLVMQCVGGLLAVASGFFILAAIEARGQGMWLFVMGAAGVARSMVHRAAGVAVTYGPGERAKGLLRTYYIAAAVHTVVVLFALDKMGLPTSLVLIGAISLAWPAALAIVTSRPGIRAVLDSSNVPPAGDLGYEGLAVIMTLLSCFGIIYMVLIDYAFLGNKMLTGSAQGLVMLLMAILLTIRSFVQLRAGVKGVSPRDYDTFNAAASGYATFGIAASVIAGALILFMSLGGFSGLALFGIVMMVGVLLIWPLTVKRYLTEKSFTRVMNDNPAPLTRAPDGGMTALGWLFLAFSVLWLALSVPALFSTGGGVPFLSQMGVGGDAHGGSSEKMQAMMSVAGASLQLWAALELIFMSQRWKIATLVYGVGATLITLYNMLQAIKMLDVLKEMGDRSPIPPVVAVLAPVLAGLVLPVGAILLALRKGFHAADTAGNTAAV